MVKLQRSSEGTVTGSFVYVRYSQGVRQAIWSILNASKSRNVFAADNGWDEVVFKTGDWTIGSLRSAQAGLLSNALEH